MSDVNNNTEQEHQQQDESYSSEENDSFAPLKNVIPIDKLKNGWFVLSSMMIQGSARVQEKIIETYNSEQVQNFKQKTVETVGPVWEKTRDAAVPVWERTRDAAAPVWEQTKQGAVSVAENFKPAFESVAELTVNSATAAYISLSDSINNVAKSFSDDDGDNFSNVMGEGEGEGGVEGVSYTVEGGPSVLDQTTRGGGGPMTV